MRGIPLQRVSLADEPARGCAACSPAERKKWGFFVSFDPNYRPFYGRRLRSPQAFEEGCAVPILSKVSEEEVSFFWGRKTPHRARGTGKKQYDALVLASAARAARWRPTLPACWAGAEALPVTVADTTGQATHFWHDFGALAGKERAALHSMTEQEAVELLHLGCMAGSLTASSWAQYRAAGKEELQCSAGNIEAVRHWHTGPCG